MIYEDEFLKLFSEFFLTKVVFFLTCSPYGMCAAQAQRYNMQLLGPFFDLKNIMSSQTIRV